MYSSYAGNSEALQLSVGTKFYGRSQLPARYVLLHMTMQC